MCIITVIPRPPWVVSPQPLSPCRRPQPALEERWRVEEEERGGGSVQLGSPPRTHEGPPPVILAPPPGSPSCPNRATSLMHLTQLRREKARERERRADAARHKVYTIS